MVFIKTMKRQHKTYKYWAQNERIGSKIKVKLLRPLTNDEISQLDLSGHVEPPSFYQPEKKSSFTNQEITLLQAELKRKSNQLDNLNSWIVSINSGYLPNTRYMVPKDFIREVLTPLLEMA